jgi:hypothetical protein
MRIGSNKDKRRCNRGQDHKKAVARHFGLPRQIRGQEDMYRLSDL